MPTCEGLTLETTPISAHACEVFGPDELEARIRAHEERVGRECRVVADTRRMRRPNGQSRLLALDILRASPGVWIAQKVFVTQMDWHASEVGRFLPGPDVETRLVKGPKNVIRQYRLKRQRKPR